MTIILIIIFVISLLHLLVILLAFFKSSKLAGKYIDTGKGERLWKISCYVKTFLISYILFWIAGVAVAIEIDTGFFSKTTAGSILGMGVMLNILATAFWWVFSEAEKSSVTYKINSLEKSLRENNRGWKLRYFFQNKSVLQDNDVVARNTHIKSLTLKDEPKDIDMNPDK